MPVPVGEPPPITLRPLDIQHREALQSVYEAAADYFQSIWQRLPPTGLAERDLADAAGDDARFLLGIYLDETIVGMIDLCLAEPEPYDVRLGLILLIPAHRRCGLGGWALRILEEWLRRATPTTAVVLTVLAQDYGAQAFFRTQGYGFTGQATRIPMGGTWSRLLFMRKNLQHRDEAQGR